jgi:hypothetical protein
MDRLGGLKFKPANLQTHWEALSDLGDAELVAAISRAQRECEEFPAPKMLRVFVDEYRGRIEVPEEDPSRAVPVEPTTFEIPEVGLKIPITREWRYYCDECNDTGMRSYWCGVGQSTRWPWMKVMHCARRNEHGEHEWVDQCQCAATNPAVLRRLARAQQVSRKTAER